MTDNNTIGFLIIDVQPTHQYLIDHINNMSKLMPFVDFVLFNSNYGYLSMSINNFYTLHLNEAKYFRGPLMVFDDNSCEFMINCISKQKILWMQEPLCNKPTFDGYFDDTYKKYQTIDTILCSDETTNDIINTLWKPSILMKEPDYDKILSHIQL